MLVKRRKQMNKIISTTEYRRILDGCNTKNIVEEDINIFQSDIKRLEMLISMAKDELGQ
jgi:hypothetical protein